jgi:hypothetical protein
VFAGLEIRSAREGSAEEHRPFVAVDLDGEDSTAYYLVIGNFGRQVAHDITFTFDPPMQTSDDDGYGPMYMRMFTEGLPTLVPGRTLRIMFDITLQVLNTPDLPTRYTITTAYRGPDGRTFEERSVIDMDIYRGRTSLGTTGVKDVVKSIDALRKSIDKGVVTREPPTRRSQRPRPPGMGRRRAGVGRQRAVPRAR